MFIRCMTSHLPDLVMIISVPSSWNLSHRSLVSRLQLMLAMCSLGTAGLQGISGSVLTSTSASTSTATPTATPTPPPTAPPTAPRSTHRDFSTNCSGAGNKTMRRVKQFHFQSGQEHYIRVQQQITREKQGTETEMQIIKHQRANKTSTADEKKIKSNQI